MERGRGRIDQVAFFARQGVRYARRRIELERALRRLAADPALRAELGGRGRAFVERYVDLDA
ncbi:MAG: hypothetical protein M3515_02715 [Actinomycetota bacterium]|nr:hypothetical protein [Actinomycetota bacterium]